MALAGVSRAATYYVDVDGIGGPSSDSNPGTISQPFKTIEKARDTIRALGKDGHTVYIRGGTYRLTSSLTFDSRDSGVVGVPNVYRNYPGENPIISGGTLLDSKTYPWTTYSHLGHTIYKTNVGQLRFNSLFVDGVRATLAREPDVGWHYVAGSVSGQTATAFKFAAGDIDPTWHDLNRVQVVYCAAWSSPRFWIDSVDDVNNTVHFGWPGSTSYGANERYYVENVFEGLDQPGEWYLDNTTGDLYYYPLGGKNPNTSETIVPVLGRTPTKCNVSVPAAYLLDVQGTSLSNPVQYLKFAGLTFEHADWHLATSGFPGYSEELEIYYGTTAVPNWYGLGPAILLRYVDHVDFTDNIVEHIGGHAIVLHGTYVNLQRNHIRDIGGTAIKIGKLSSSDSGSGVSSYNVVSDNTIHDIASIWLNGMAVMIAISDHGLYTHNLVYDTHYMGFCCGRGIAYGGDCTYNEVSYNEIYNIQKSLGDGAAVYFVGTQTGSVGKNNKIHDCNGITNEKVDESMMGGWGLYLDENASGVTLENNWLYRINRGLNINGAWSCSVTNNVFADITWGFMTYVFAFGTSIQKNIYYNMDAQQTPYLCYYPEHLNPYTQNWNLWYNALPSYQATWDSRVASIRNPTKFGSAGVVDVVKEEDGSSTLTRVSGSVFQIHWTSGMPVDIDGTEYPLASVADTSHMTLANGPVTKSGANYKIYYHMDPNSILQDPLFVDFASANFNLRAGSPALLPQGSGGIGFQQIDMSTVGPRAASYTILASAGAGGGVSPSGETTVAEGVPQTFTFTPDAGYSVANVEVDGVPVGAVSSYTFSNVSDDHSITVEFGAGAYTLEVVAANGSVTKSPDKSSYTYNESVSLTPVPAAGYRFMSWSGDLTGSGNPAIIAMDGNKSVTANFAAGMYSLSITASGGSVSKSPDKASYAYGDVVTLQAAADPGSMFSSWSGDASGTNGSVTVTMNGDKSVTASFTANTYVLTTAGTNGSVTKTPSQASYAYSAVVMLQAVPSTGYSFSGWSGDASGPTNPATVTMTENKSVTANFVINTYTLNATALNGSVTKSPDKGSYTYNESVRLQAVAQAAYEFTGWSGDLSGATNPATLVMNSDKSVTAGFRAVTPDNAPPTLYGFSPPPDGIQVPLNSLVLLHVSDGGKGVDANTVAVAVNGTTVYTGNTTSYSTIAGVCRRIGSKADYTYVYQAENDFDFDQKVTVTVNAADLAGNVLPEYSYSFTTEMRAFGRNLKASTGLANLEKGRPATVRDSVGDIWAVWQAGAVGQRDIYLGKLARGSDSFGDPVRLTTGSADESNPDLAIGADNRLYVVWQDNRRGSWDVYVKTSADGVTWSDERRVTDSKSNHVRPAVVVDAQSPNRAYVAWQDDGAGNQDIYVASSNDGFVTKAIAQVTSDALDQTSPKMAVDSSHTVYLVWTDPRNGSDDIYGASSVVGPWTNVPVVTGTGNQNSPAIATEAAGTTVHIAWVDDASGNQDIHYAFSNGLPASPLVGMNLVDDARGANQTAPTIATLGSAGHGLKVFVCWRDERNITAQGGDADLYFVEVRTPAATNILIGDGGAGSDQSEPAMGIDSFGYPYVVWTDSRNPAKDIYYCGSTFMEEDALDSRLASASVGATVGVVPPSKAEDASILIPANACPYDVTVTIRRMQNLQSGLVPCISSYDFGPSGLDFDVPVTITIPYSVGAYNATPLLPYWHDSQMNMLSQQGITDVETLQISPTVRAVRFKATHFTPYVLLPAATGASGGGGGGGGCSLSAYGESDPYGYFVPYVILAVVMGILRLRGTTRYSTSHGSPRRGRT